MADLKEKGNNFALDSILSVEKTVFLSKIQLTNIYGGDGPL